jgi:hypothetical protein
VVPTAEVAAPVALTAEAEVAEVAAAAPEAEAEVEAEASADKEKECVKLMAHSFLSARTDNKAKTNLFNALSLYRVGIFAANNM